MSDVSGDSSDLYLSCSVSSVDNEESELSELEGDLQIVEPYRFEPIASSESSLQSDTELDDDDSGEGSAVQADKNFPAWLGQSRVLQYYVSLGVSVENAL